MEWVSGIRGIRIHLRINCGGGEVTDASGRLWSEDRFYLPGGRTSSPWKGNFQTTEDDELYHSGRYFPPFVGRSGYRIPVPPGRYRVTLHFRNTTFWPVGCWRFDISLEGHRVLKGYEPLSIGAIKTDRRVFEAIEVSDGALDILFDPDCGEPSVAAIEIQGL